MRLDPWKPKTIEVPIGEAERISRTYGYSQVLIYARNPETGQEHMTTYGRTLLHCRAMAKVGRFLQTKIMGWFDARKDDDAKAG